MEITDIEIGKNYLVESDDIIKCVKVIEKCRKGGWIVRDFYTTKTFYVQSVNQVRLEVI